MKRKRTVITVTEMITGDLGLPIVRILATGHLALHRDCSSQITENLISLFLFSTNRETHQLVGIVEK